MANPHGRGLPPPAGMGIPQQPPPPQHLVQQPPPTHQHAQPPPHIPHSSHGHHHRDSWSSALPPPPQPSQQSPQWQGSSDESMRTWLAARTEEEKTKQEEEKTRQESLRLEQRKIEIEILRASFSGGIPPPMVPLIFAGMGGGVLPQAAIDWAQALLPPQQQVHHPQLLPPQRAASPDPQREGPAYHAQPGAAATQSGYAGYESGRPRGQTISGAIGHSSSGSIGGLMPGPSGYQPHRGGAQPQPQQQQDNSQSIYFHHWQPPGTAAGGSGSASNRPGTPSGDGQRKRKVGAESYHQSRASSPRRSRSPPSHNQPTDFTSQTGNRRGHKRHKSDVTWYQPRHNFSNSGDSTQRPGTPAQDNSSVSSRDRDAQEDRKPAPAYSLAREREEEPRSRTDPRAAGHIHRPERDASYEHRDKQEHSLEVARRPIPEER